MAEFHSLALVKYPPPVVFETARDAIDRAVHFVDDVERVVTESRVERSPGVVEITNTWYCAIPLPPILARVLSPHHLVWTDHATWTASDHACRWYVVSHYFPNHVRCSGSTRFGATTNGRATSVALDGTVDVNASGIPGLPDLAANTIARGVEEFICTLFPWALRKVVDGVSRTIEEPTRRRDQTYSIGAPANLGRNFLCIHRRSPRV